MATDNAKINIVGLQNAGKTSIILTLLREFKSLEKLKPTKGINRTKYKFLNRNLNLWDMGGQARYREEYLKKPDINFADIEELIFVVDVQDKAMIKEAIEYYSDVTKEVQQYSPNASINICLHKYDPGLDKQPEFIQLLEELAMKFTEITKNMPVRINYTSIYNPMSVVLAFSKPLFGNTTLYDNFGFLFNDAINKFGIDFAIIITENLMEIGNAFAPYMEPEMMKMLSDSLFSEVEKSHMKIPEIKVRTQNMEVQMILFEAGGKSFYFTYGFDTMKNPDGSPIHAEMMNLLEDIRKFMRYF